MSPNRKPDYCLNVGMTWPGLVALGVTDRLPPIPPGTFDAFVEGAARRAGRLGDHGVSGPEHWVGGFGTGDDHVMMALYALTPEARETYSGQLTALFKEGDAFELLWQFDGDVMLENDRRPVPVAKTHFGYTDGITATPRIVGGPEPVAPDHQEPCEPWLFILSDDADSYHLPEPAGALAQRELRRVQDDGTGCRRLPECSCRRTRTRSDPELLAAKICGRWRNGVPLVLSPDTDSPYWGHDCGTIERLRVCEQRRFR